MGSSPSKTTSWLCVLNSLSLHLLICQMGTMRRLTHRAESDKPGGPVCASRSPPLLWGSACLNPFPSPKGPSLPLFALCSFQLLSCFLCLICPLLRLLGCQLHSSFKEGTASGAFPPSLSGRTILPVSHSPIVSLLERFRGRMTGIWGLKTVLCSDHMTLHETLLPPSLIWPLLRSGDKNQALALCSGTSWEPWR